MNLADAYDEVLNALRQERRPDVVIRQVVEWCESVRPHKDWSLLEGKDAVRDLDELARWFKALLVDEPPATTITTFWLGLFNPDWGAGPTAGVYVAGSSRAATDDDFDTSEYWPDGRYPRCPFLETVFQRAYRAEGLGNDLEYPMALAFGGLLARTLSPLLQGHARSTGSDCSVAVGFDGGDLMIATLVSIEGVTELWETC